MVWNQQDSMIRRIVPQAIGTFLISLLLATRLGPAIVDATFLVPMACLAMLFVAPLVIRTRKLPQSIGIAFGMMAVSIALCLAWTGAGVPETQAIVKAIIYSLLTTSAVAGLTLLLLTKTPIRPNLVIWIIRGLLLALYFAYRAWPESFML